MLRGLLGLGGTALAIVAWPVADGAWQTQKADSAFFEFRTGMQMRLDQAEAAVTTLDRAVVSDRGFLGHSGRGWAASRN